MSTCDRCQSRDVPDQQSHDECAANSYRDQSGGTWEGCRAASPEAQAKQANRSGQTCSIWSEPTCFDRLCKRDSSPFYQWSAPILKWFYPAVCGHGTYRQDMMVQSIHRYEVRVQRLRGKPEPRLRDEVERSVDIRADQQTGGIYHALYYKYPAFALIRKDATVGR